MKTKLLNIISFFKKNTWLFWALLVTSILIPLWISDYKKITSNSRYALGRTTESYASKGTKRLTRYVFYVDGNIEKGSHTELLMNARDDIIVPDGKYLVIYAVDDPEVSILLVDNPIRDTINLDSLNALGVDKSKISWLDL